MTDHVEIYVEHVTKRFGSRNAVHVALDDVDVHVNSAKSLGIVGESGSGKSTLARIIVGLETVSSGVVTYNGLDLRAVLRSRALREDFRRSVQFVGQDTTSSFDPLRTLRDSVRTPAMKLCGLSARAADERVEETLVMLGLLPSMVDRYPRNLSGGQRQRFALARALVVRPRLLVCDEVVSALDVSVQGQILNYIKDYCRDNEASVAFVSHGLPATAFVSDDLLVMLEGKIVEHNDKDSVLLHSTHPYTQKLLNSYRSGAVADGALATQKQPVAAGESV